MKEGAGNKPKVPDNVDGKTMVMQCSRGEAVERNWPAYSI